MAYRWKWRADDERWAYGDKAPRQCFELTPLLIAAGPSVEALREWQTDERDILETIELGLKRGYTPDAILDENSPIRDRIRAALAALVEVAMDDEEAIFDEVRRILDITDRELPSKVAMVRAYRAVIEPRARREALEEAALLCDAERRPPFGELEWEEGARSCAAKIRALIDAPPGR